MKKQRGNVEKLKEEHQSGKPDNGVNEMKVLFEKTSLSEAVTNAMCAVYNKRDNPILNCIKIKTDGDSACHISSFDSEKGFDITLNAEVYEEGACLVNGISFSGMVKNMPGDIMFECKDNMTVSLSSEKSVYEIQYLDAKMFPNTPDLTARQSFTLKQGDLRDIILQTSFAIGENNARLQLNGAYFVVKGNTLTVVALDGLRFAQRVKTCEIANCLSDGDEVDTSFIIPKRSLSEVVKLLNSPDELIQVSKSRKHVIFKIDNQVFFSQQIEGDYIEYSRFMPKNETTCVKVSTAAVRESLERALLITEYKEAGKLKSPVKLTFDGNTLSVSSVSSANRVYDEISIEKTGKDLEIGFNCKILIDCFRAVESQEVILKLSTPFSAMVLNPVDDDDNSFYYFVFPTKIVENY